MGFLKQILFLLETSWFFVWVSTFFVSFTFVLNPSINEDENPLLVVSNFLFAGRRGIFLGVGASLFWRRKRFSDFSSSISLLYWKRKTLLKIKLKVHFKPILNLKSNVPIDLIQFWLQFFILFFDTCYLLSNLSQNKNFKFV